MKSKNLALQVSTDDLDGVLRYKLSNYGLFDVEFCYLIFESYYSDNNFGLPSLFCLSLIFIINHAMCTTTLNLGSSETDDPADRIPCF